MVRVDPVKSAGKLQCSGEKGPKAFGTSYITFNEALRTGNGSQPSKMDVIEGHSHFTSAICSKIRKRINYYHGATTA
jgi:hypothetical protein